MTSAIDPTKSFGSVDLTGLYSSNGVTDTQGKAGFRVDELPPKPDAVGQEKDDIPNLTASTSSFNTAVLSGVPSLGASVLALTAELADQQRQANNEQRIGESQAIIQKMHDEADDIRSYAAAQLVMGLVSAGITIGTSAYQVGSTASNLNSVAGIENEQLQGARLAAANARTQGIVQGWNGVASMMNAGKEFTASIGTAAQKDTEADIEQMRQYLSQLDSLNDALKEVIQQAISSQQAVEQSTNQARVKILS